MRVPLMRNAFINEAETKKQLAEFIVNADMFSMGKECAKFEEKFAKWQGIKYALLFNSGGSANLALLQSLKSLGKLKDGDRVGFSSLTWSTNVMPIIQMGMIPVPVDVDKNTANVMSHNLLDRLKDVNLHAFFATNVLGYCGDLPEIKRVCDEKGIVFIEDNCEGLGGRIACDHFGNFGLGSTFSFFVAHHMSTIEGGMFCTSDDELYRMMKITRANGWDRNVTLEQQEKMRASYNINPFFAKYSFYELAFNFRPTEITGFLGQTQMQYIDDNISKRLANHTQFDAAIKANNDLIHIVWEHIDSISPFGLIILCKTPKLRDKYLKKFMDAEVEVRPVIAGNMQNQPFYKNYVKELYALPNTDFYNNCGFYCGNYPEMRQDDIDIICACLSK
ncbi:MAG: DegT/DnrJ/EryC1/StrS family aminotransferase [Bacteroidales bacterium]